MARPYKIHQLPLAADLLFVPLTSGLSRRERPSSTGPVMPVAITRRLAGGYAFDWKVGATAYHGEGELKDGIVTVHWGDVEPVVYALTGDHELKGLWSNGDGEETLSLEE